MGLEEVFTTAFVESRIIGGLSPPKYNQLSCSRNENISSSDIQAERENLKKAIAAQENLRGAVQEAQKQADQIMERVMEIDSWDEPDFGEILFLASGQAALHSLGDARADQVLEQTYTLIMDFAKKITTPEHRRQFLENILWHREIVESWEAKARER